MEKLKKIIGSCFLFFTIHSSGQDLHFSQYFNAPLLVNPANTGFNPDYRYRIGGNYRTQWANVGTPYNTMSLWGDSRVLEDRFENGLLGFLERGLQFPRTGSSSPFQPSSGSLPAANG